MKLWDVIKSVGSGIVRELPGGDLALDVVNAMLPDDKKLPAGATGRDIESAVMLLPADKRAELLSREVDVKVEHLKQQGETTRAMLEAESRSTHTTRPRIALGAFRVNAFAVLAVVSAWCWAVVTDRPDVVTMVQDGWPMLLALIGPNVALLRAYFGILKVEHRNRLDAANGRESQPEGLAGALSAMIRRK